ncbi:hypothetical protein CK203_003457 [Vitis vinifera]|uniref:Uncharacterized protein n=1 Tax=Vitis vinifera TaxID=29760 RepID=A0A438K8D8_VITVI|nr:hypothetical protein CK203_003457 [Vitis vinifera]
MGFGSETGDISTPRKAGFPSIAESRKIVRAECVQEGVRETTKAAGVQHYQYCGNKLDDLVNNTEMLIAGIVWSVTDKWGVDVGCYHGSMISILLREGETCFLSSLWSKVAIAQQLGSALNYLAFCNLSHGLQAMWCQNPLKHLKKATCTCTPATRMKSSCFGLGMGKDWHLYLMLFFLYSYSQLGAVRYVPWVKQHINYTGRALIISAGMVLNSFFQIAFPCFKELETIVACTGPTTNVFHYTLQTSFPSGEQEKTGSLKRALVEKEWFRDQTSIAVHVKDAVLDPWSTKKGNCNICSAESLTSSIGDSTSSIGSHLYQTCKMMQHHQRRCRLHHPRL